MYWQKLQASITFESSHLLYVGKETIFLVVNREYFICISKKPMFGALQIPFHRSQMWSWKLKQSLFILGYVKSLRIASICAKLVVEAIPSHSVQIKPLRKQGSQYNIYDPLLWHACMDMGSNTYKSLQVNCITILYLKIVHM